MPKCNDCKTFKKADNCIACYQAERKKVEDIRRLVESTPYHRLGGTIQDYLNGVLKVSA